ncbi:hypothetical protein MMC10_001074 [Thelotrema lepadinum]|nr:hypothetical protein [Thelotrema lepadinum]
MDREEDFSLPEMLGLAKPTPMLMSDEDLFSAIVFYKDLVGHDNLADLETVLENARDNYVEFFGQSFDPDDEIAELEDELFAPRIELEEAEEATQEAFEKGDIKPGTQNHSDWCAATMKEAEIRMEVDLLEQRLRVEKSMKRMYEAAAQSEDDKINNIERLQALEKEYNNRVYTAGAELAKKRASAAQAAKQKKAINNPMNTKSKPKSKSPSPSPTPTSNGTLTFTLPIRSHPNKVVKPAHHTTTTAGSTPTPTATTSASTPPTNAALTAAALGNALRETTNVVKKLTTKPKSKPKPKRTPAPSRFSLPQNPAALAKYMDDMYGTYGGEPSVVGVNAVPNQTPAQMMNDLLAEPWDAFDWVMRP